VSDELLSLVRTHLDREAETIDPRAAFARLRGPEPVRPARRADRRLAGLALLAAALMVAAFFWPTTPARADPAAIVADARGVHHQPLDRVYIIETKREPAEDGPPPRIARVFTRGDRFWVEGALPGPAWAAGQDESGSVWMAIGPRRGVRIAADEMPRWLAGWCDLHSLRVEPLLDDLLRNYSLTREDQGPTSGVDVITAKRRPAQFLRPLVRAKLEIDRESKVLRRAVLERELPADVNTTTTYTLIDTRSESNDRYELEGHLTAPFEVYTKSNEPGRRREILERLFGPRAKLWLKN
jgi:hypothetical protein